MEQQAPEIIFTVLLGGTLIIWIGILLFSKEALRNELQANALELGKHDSYRSDSRKSLLLRDS